MKAWSIEDYGLRNLILKKVLPQKIESKSVRVKIRACSLNYRDYLVIMGLYNKKMPLPLVPLSDGAGEVIEVGKGVTEFKIGDKVCATFSQKWLSGPLNKDVCQNTLGCPLDGMLRQEVVLNEEGLIKFPPHLSFEEASTLPCAGLTAFNAIFSQNFLRPNDTILLEGTGGVSLFALQFAKALKLNTILLSSTQEKMDKAKSFGADHVINYRKNPDWSKEVLNLTDGQGVKAVIEVGGQDTLPKAIKSLSKGGAIFLIGIVSGSMANIDLIPILMNDLRIFGIFVGHKAMFLSMNTVIEHALIRPVIDKVFDFKDADKAFNYLKSQAHFGKICICI